ncbi:MAG: alpha-galactosidase [Capsulimonadaceae bacterium]|nr:alpha-galactosidase [Capsulimonadaceae bacterium]
MNGMTLLPPTTLPAALDDAYARLDGDLLVTGNSLIERRWRLRGGVLETAAIVDKARGVSWTRPLGDAATQSKMAASFAVELGQQTAVSSPSLTVAVDLAIAAYRIEVFPGVPSIVTSATRANAAAVGGELLPEAAPTGIETASVTEELADDNDIADLFTLNDRNARLKHVVFADRTDGHNELVLESSYRLHWSESRLVLSGNLFAIELILSRGGLAFLKLAPLPHARPDKTPFDLSIAHGRNVVVSALAGGDRCATLTYDGTQEGLTRALHGLQRAFRGYEEGRDGLFVSNTWGDRGQDGRVSESFLLREIDVARRVGVDVVQIDDGWQAGRTSNSVEAGGIWEGFQADKGFWKAHRERFPRGLAPVVAAARAAGLSIGLWFAPDSSSDFAHWRADADTLLDIHRTMGISAFKIDGVELRSRLGAERLHEFLRAVREESAGRIVCDLDVTAQTRPGYFGAPEAGPVFVENRYTDTPSYYPHATLRNLWSLAQYIDPIRLRIELLNNARNAAKYGDDPLAPVHYDPAYLFASAMLASPLGWFELTGLSEAYVARVTPLVALWRTHRDELRRGVALPAGEQPDGGAWTGFVVEAQGKDALHVLAFRELNDRPSTTFTLPLGADGWKTEVLFGDGVVHVSGRQAKIELPSPLSFVWARVSA